MSTETRDNQTRGCQKNSDFPTCVSAIRGRFPQPFYTDYSTSTDYLIGKSADSSPNRLVVEQSDTPALFFLVETCKTLNAAQLMRLTAYAKTLSNVTSDSEK